ncbi:hypothetical protein [Streptomyces sp. NPDC051000]|uniref:hypothetical protein n=1 Tax=Streptomyces sp. NPDC051000 TaxID=3155520 RepID=UPI0033CE4665
MPDGKSCGPRPGGTSATTPRVRLDAADYNPVTVVGDGSQGCAAYAPYDRVLVTASLRQILADIIRQTRPGGPTGFPCSPSGSRRKECSPTRRNSMGGVTRSGSGTRG